jgi:hypothetical protein
MGALQIGYVQAHELASLFREINFARLSDDMIDDIVFAGTEWLCRDLDSKELTIATRILYDTADPRGSENISSNVDMPSPFPHSHAENFFQHGFALPLPDLSLIAPDRQTEEKPVGLFSFFNWLRR